MLENLACSLRAAFGNGIRVELKGPLLHIVLKGVELVIDERGDLYRVSRVSPARFEMPIDNPHGGIAPTGSPNRI